MTAVMSPSNALPHSQRLRLIRSIRKLGDLLTESALLVEPVPHQSSHVRTSSMSPTLSTARPASHSPAPRAPQDGPQPILSIPPTSALRRNFFSLRLPKPRDSDSDSTPLSTPLSATFSVALNSPATPVVNVAALQERKLAKVAQTLGENVPPELVLPGRRKRASTVSVPEARSPPVVVARRRHARTPSRMLKHAASSTSLHESPAPVPEFEPFSYPSLVPVPSTPEAPKAWATLRGVGTAMHRKEAGWSGEWSGTVQNMDDVVRGLRGLRFK
ncbi:hypothetical protein B0H15DRAFT_385816 [Mycena belliarum]|uniref:Uncharacterized protein n=1 Tax=Mycena belliarum TaxID=1033014 RepID=A0AAD6U3M3_9AGAR|nr:hypothetical protein B0H15DRAFT_385816 [Mycena belliae]